jgi:hypothetical protein
MHMPSCKHLIPIQKDHQVRLRIELPDAAVTAEAVLYAEAAPQVAEFIWGTLAKPLHTMTSHACFDGHEVYCFLDVPPDGDPAPEAQNITIRPQPGDLVYFYAPAGKFAAVGADARLRGQTSDVHELAFMYDEVDLRHYWEEGWIGSVVGHIDDGLSEFAGACRATLVSGSTRLIVSRVG